MSGREITFRVVNSAIFEFASDAVILKYPQELLGADKTVVKRRFIRTSIPQEGECSAISDEALNAKQKIFLVGVKGIGLFDYKAARKFGEDALKSLPKESGHKFKRLSFRVPQAEFGLDFSAAFEAEICGMFHAIAAGDFPKDLNVVSFVDSDLEKVKMLSAILEDFLPNEQKLTTNSKMIESLSIRARAAFDAVGKPKKKSVFVAMPFAVKDMEQLFHFPIKEGIEKAEMLCERLDVDPRVGDMMDRLKKRIAASEIVVAEVSDFNPNVYLEVGYAWGLKRPTILLARKGTSLPFDIRGHYCIFYNDMMDLKEQLANQLKTEVWSPQI